MDNSAADKRIARVPVPAVNCPRCVRLFAVPAGKGEGDIIQCPFCAAQMVLRVRSLLVAEPVEAA